MTTMTIMRGPDGKLDGFTEDDRRKWAMFCNELRQLGEGELCQVSHWFSRSRPFHNLHMRVVRDVFEAQERFEQFDILRKWLYVGAGHADFVPGKDGQMCAIAKSVAYGELDDADVRIVHEKVLDFLRSDHAQKTLWPHLREDQTYEIVETLLSQYERQPA